MGLTSALGGLQHGDTCPNCGYCKYCGRSNNYQTYIYQNPTWTLTTNAIGEATNGTDFNAGPKPE